MRTARPEQDVEPTPDERPVIGQLALNQLHGGLHRWYREGLGLLPSGGSLFAGPPAAKVNGLAFPIFPARWLSDGRELVQIELFRFLRPRPRPRRPDETPADLGYRRIGFHVDDLDSTLARLADLGSAPLGPVLGDAGGRRACVRDPEGNWVELLEDDPLDRARGALGASATLRSITVSVADLDHAVEVWREGVGLAPLPAELHSAEHEATWGLAGARRRTVVLDGGGVLLELVRYDDPAGRPEPEGRRICDQGIMNVALVVDDRPAFDRTFERWRELGFVPSSPTPLEVGIFRVMYFDLPSGENVELLYPRRWARRLTGFVPGGLPASPGIERELVRATARARWSTG